MLAYSTFAYPIIWRSYSWYNFWISKTYSWSIGKTSLWKRNSQTSQVIFNKCYLYCCRRLICWLGSRTNWRKKQKGNQRKEHHDWCWSWYCCCILKFNCSFIVSHILLNLYYFKDLMKKCSLNFLQQLTNYLLI